MVTGSLTLSPTGGLREPITNSLSMSLCSNLTKRRTVMSITFDHIKPKEKNYAPDRVQTTTNARSASRHAGAWSAAGLWQRSSVSLNGEPT